MTSRAVLQVFEEYQSSRTKFIQTVAELAMRPQNIDILQNAGAMQLLRHLLIDAVPNIQQSTKHRCKVQQFSKVLPNDSGARK